MKDWKGNDICIGHTVMVIAHQTIDSGTKFRTGLIIYDINGNPTTFLKGEEGVSPMEYTWECRQKSLITEEWDIIEIGWINGKIPINHIDHWISAQPWECICIEGLSDNEEEFRLKQFEA